MGVQTGKYLVDSSDTARFGKFIVHFLVLILKSSGIVREKSSIV
jgi:hypothetical protein